MKRIEIESVEGKSVKAVENDGEYILFIWDDETYSIICCEGGGYVDDYNGPLLGSLSNTSLITNGLMAAEEIKAIEDKRQADFMESTKNQRLKQYEQLRKEFG